MTAPKTDEEAVVEPVRKRVRVERTTEEAFRLFTEHIDRWWPVEVRSRAADEQYGEGVKVERVVFEPRAGGRLYEVTSEGVDGVWAEIVAYELMQRRATAGPLPSRNNASCGGVAAAR